MPAAAVGIPFAIAAIGSFLAALAVWWHQHPQLSFNVARVIQDTWRWLSRLPGVLWDALVDPVIRAGLATWHAFIELGGRLADLAGVVDWIRGVVVPDLAARAERAAASALGAAVAFARAAIAATVGALEGRIGALELDLRRELGRVRDLALELVRGAQRAFQAGLEALQRALEGVHTDLLGRIVSILAALTGLQALVAAIEAEGSAPVRRCRGMLDRLCSVPKDFFEFVLPTGWTVLFGFMLQRAAPFFPTVVSALDDVADRLLDVGGDLV